MVYVKSVIEFKHGQKTITVRTVKTPATHIPDVLAFALGAYCPFMREPDMWASRKSLSS